MSAARPEIWVVVSNHDGCMDDPRGPLVWETYTEGATREMAQKRAAQCEKRNGACRIARVIFEDELQEITK